MANRTTLLNNSFDMVLAPEFKDNLLNHLAEHDSRLSYKAGKHYLVYDEIRIEREPYGTESEAVQVSFYKDGQRICTSGGHIVMSKGETLHMTKLDGLVPFKWSNQ